MIEIYTFRFTMEAEWTSSPLVILTSRLISIAITSGLVLILSTSGLVLVLSLVLLIALIATFVL